MATPRSNASPTNGSGGADMMLLNVRLGSRDPQVLTVSRSWTGKQLKEHIVEELEIESGAVDLLFTGKGVPDDIHIGSVLGEHTYINAVKASGMRPNFPCLEVEARDVSVHDEELLSLAGDTDAGADTSGSAQSYYVYCRNKCKEVQPAKLRVRCDTCKLGTMTPERDPRCWEDVLTKKQIGGECHAKNCHGTHAEYFFKCAGHNAGENESLPPLCQVVTNTRRIPCIVCFEDDRPELYVFECPDRHVICMGCLKTQCTTKIQDRQFVQTEEHGYTLPCPAPGEACKTAYITDPHTFKIVGKDLWAQYQNYATQEYTLQQGGVLCPAPNCGFGIIPPTDERRVECPDANCKYVFCRTCKQDYHAGDCNLLEMAQAIANDPSVSPEQAARARLDVEAYRAIDELACKRCPACRSTTHKYDGCNHVECRMCRFQYCWLCLTEWNPEHQRHWFRDYV